MSSPPAADVRSDVGGLRAGTTCLDPAVLLCLEAPVIGPDRGRPRRACLLVLGLFGPAQPSVGIRDILVDVGVSVAACRSALHRLRQDGLITSRREGRHAVVRLTAKGTDAADELIRRITEDPPLIPVGRWLQVVYRTGDPRASRSLRDWLERRGFATLSPGVWLHRVDHRPELHRRFGRLDGLHVLVSEPVPGVEASLWDLRAIRDRWEQIEVPAPRLAAGPEEQLALLLDVLLGVLAADDGDPQLPDDVAGPWHPRDRALHRARYLLEATRAIAGRAVEARVPAAMGTP